jgi:prepilin-type N-terminal cleavage/methylation domain-containing protein
MTLRSAGFTLVETAIVLVIIGLLIAAVLQGQELIRGARVRNLISEQDAVGAAVLAFQDRYRALPGDFRDASTTIPCDPACVDGNGNGLIEDVGTVPEYILVWSHLAGAGFLNAAFSAGSGTASPGPGNTPTNTFGGYLQVIYDANRGYSANPTKRHNIKTGNQMPVEIATEMYRKIDDGLPTSGRFQFSPYSATGSAPDWGGSDTSCTNQDFPDPYTVWNVTNGQSNCGGATLL